MIRTRNFFLFILVLAFLVGGIILTIWFSADTSAQNSYRDMLFGSDTETMTAEVATSTNDKQSRLEELRKKLATFTDVALAPSTTEDDPTPTETPATTTVTTIEPAKLQRCANYTAVNAPQLVGGLIYAEMGGQRTFSATETMVSDSTSTPPTITQKVVFTLPLRFLSLGVTECVGTDIVAVTPNGLPIRNTDVAAYSSSGESTLIGYTIDGLTLYGKTSSIETDECGGAVVGGVYRYYMSPERETILNCFVAIPVAL